jgi:plasmid stabilization system protein ParE
MSERPRKGRPVAFATIAPTSAQADPVLGLKFTVEARHGGTVLIDMTALDPRPLAIAFAGALRRSAALGGPIGAASVIKQYVRVFRIFFAWLAKAAPEAIGASDLRAEHIDRFAAALERSGMGAIHRHTTVSKIVNMLRAIDADRPDWIAPDLRERLRYTMAVSVGRSTPRDAYSPFVARALRDAARGDVEALFRRLGADDRTDAADAVIEAARANVEALIAREGSVTADRSELRALYFMRLRRGLPISTLIDDLHARHHLLARDLPPLLVLLTLDTGLEPECLKRLTVDCLANAHAGTVELRYLKRRARGAEHKSMRIRDGGAGTPGGLIRRLIDVTAAARKHLPGDCLWAYHNVGGLRGGIFDLKHQFPAWARRHGILDDDGEPLNLLLSRLRKTHKALWYAKTEGHMTRFAVGHSREVAARHYADLPSLRPLHEATVADAFREAVAAAMPTVLTPIAEQALRDAPDQAASLVPPDAVRPLLDGEQDVWLAACAGFHNSPFAEAGAPCAQPFWGCLDCPNAVITARKLPAILAFLAFVEEQRQGLPAADWATKFGRVHARITSQVLPAFSNAVIADARRQMSTEQLYLPPEARG